MKYYLIKKETGEVKSISESKIIFDKTLFVLKGISATPTEQELINQNYRIKYTDKLEFEKPPQIKEKEDKDDLKIQIDNAKNLNEVKEIIKNLL